jgi:hypothetical protein
LHLKTLRGPGIVVSALLLWSMPGAAPVQAHPTFYTNRCASCHYHTNDGATCDGCHFHKGQLLATADHTQYGPGDPVVVTLSGGSEGGWIRGLLYDQNNTEIDRRTGPTGTGDDGLGHPVTFPVTLHGTAPAESGDYTWQAAWFGNTGNGGDTHGELRAPVVIHVVQDPSAVPIPSFALRTWGRLKTIFR